MSKSLSRFHILIVLVACMMVCGISTSAFAEATDEINVNWKVDGGLTGSTGALWLTFELLKDYVAPQKCIWCKTNQMDETITDSLSWPTPKYAAKTADAVAFGGIPLLAVGALALSSGLEGRIQNLGADAILLAESITISSLANQFVKFGVGRARPFTIRDDPEMYKDRADDNLSFYSGHTNMAFALVVSAGTIAHIRNYKAEPYIWGIGMPLALFVAYTRVAAQKHYFTDVLIGAVIGSAIGFAVPWLHRNTSKNRKNNSSVVRDVSMNLGNNMVSISGKF
ncbi:MAG: phosphatase PAP2 family protein [Proteobacteria bacterium]|nr:phosphatase PAP2 family protein [Pseudomonadota bacterium]